MKHDFTEATMMEQPKDQTSRVAPNGTKCNLKRESCLTGIGTLEKGGVIAVSTTLPHIWRNTQTV